MDRFVHMRRALALASLSLIALVNGSPTPLSAQAAADLIISEVHPSGSGNSTYGVDWIEITNTGTTAVDIAGWRIDDNSNAFASAVPLRGVTLIPAGSSAVFFEGTVDGSTDATIRSSFTSAWFGTPSLPIGLLIGAYGGSGIGLGTGGDAVNLFNAAGERVTGVSFGAAMATNTFDNVAGIGSTTLPLPAISNLSAAGVNGAFTASGETGSPGRIAAPPSFSTIDLASYVRVGRFPLPEPLTVPAPPGNLLGQEASAVAYNWDTDTLFITGDGGRSIVQVTKTGQLIDTMTLAEGTSPQGTDFYDPEGITYVGGGRFVMSEERDRRAVLFTYAAGTTLTRADTQTVTLGTFAPNIGNEGLSYDPLTNGFIVVKETQPQGIFQTNIDFAAGTATRGSATTENPENLFDPALLGLADLADVFALSNLPTITGPGAANLLVLSQESGRILNVDREGNIASVLTILPEPGHPLSVADMQHEGLTMDSNGVLYVVNENGGGNIDHPELWVYAPSPVPNQAPTGLTLFNQLTSIAEHTVISPRRKVADIAILDDGLGANDLTLTGADAASFDVDVMGLYLRAGTSLDFETKASYAVTVAVDDPTLGGNPDATTAFTLTVTDIVEAPGELPSIAITEVAPWGSGNAPYAADWFELTNTGTTAVNVTGWRIDDDSNAFANGRALTGVSTIAPGESVIFMETANLAGTSESFLSAWFGPNRPAGLQIGAYTGAGVGLGTGGDAVNIFDGAGTRIAGVTVGASPTVLFRSFDNAAAVNAAAITLLSTAGVNGAFVAANDAAEVGSPGRIAAPAIVIISEVTPWSSSSAVGADWFEVTNIGAATATIAGWKIDDSSESPAGAALLNGITTIAPGESVIFFETSNLDATRAAFINNWFGGNAPAGLQFGSYSGTGLGLSTGGDAVNLYNQFNVLQSKVFFGIASSGSPLATFDNAAGINFAGISLLSVAGVNGAFIATNAAEIGSPGTIFADTIAPVIAPIANILVTTSGPAAVVTFATSATDNVSAPVNILIECTTPSGSTFAAGTTMVTCTARDEAGNTSAPMSFAVVVNRAPLAAPDTQSTLEGQAIKIAVQANDSDPDLDLITLSSVGSASNGTTAVASDSVIYIPNADFHGTDAFDYVIVDGRGGSATGTVTVTVSRIGRFVALSRDLTWLRAGATALTGDIGAIAPRVSNHDRDKEKDDDQGDVTVRVGQSASVRQTGSRVVGDTVLLQHKASVYNVVDNTLIARRNSVILGTETRPMSVPFVALPVFPPVQAGGSLVNVARNTTRILTPGAYGAVRVATGGTLILSGGLYQLESLDIAASATVMFSAATDLRIQTDLVSRAKARLILDPAVAGLRASQVVVYVAGRDEDSKRIEADDDGDEAGPVTVHIGALNVVQANIYAERGTVWLKSKTRATGSFIGMHVRIGSNAELTLDSAFK